MNLRQLHTYIGLFIAPSVLFFALTGALQIFGLHEANGDYAPAPIVEKLSRVHKDQVFALGEHHHEPPKAAAPAGGKPPAAPDDDGPSLPTMLLKWFFLVVALGLTASTSLGLWIGLTHVRHRKTGWIVLAAGAVIPVALLLI
jgi:hypothetical protein